MGKTETTISLIEDGNQEITRSKSVVKIFLPDMENAL
tara:strand:- start:540 stop:650 length:111 start_codon:yes stop_codon:yes gene_type:complete